ncbi:MAG: transcriptional repressor, partial [Candidatus Heimdallarchaeota archaeon]|nr:transcriptional repressor [Candidatus Heimdallarchaeota archaeon]MCK5049146.1 transcriptional repressor [Candidatus Heimdallarchaeota archaeon]
ITYEPKVLEIYSRDLIKLFKEHHKIVWGIRDEEKLKFMTVKEIHELFKDEEGKYSKSLKTVYRYVEKLKEAGIIVEAGRRVTKDSRFTEFLYSLKAELIFFEDPPEEERWWNKEETLKDYIDKLFPLIQSQVEEEKLDEEVFKKFLTQFNSLKATIIDEIVLQAEHNKTIADVYRKTHVGKINTLNDVAALMVILMNHSEIFDPIRKC